MTGGKTKPARRRKTGQESNSASFHVSFDGSVYLIDVGDLSFADQVAIRVESGMSRMEFAEALHVGLDPELIAGLVWLTAKRDGRPDLTYREVLSALTMSSILSPEEAGDAGPPASADASSKPSPT